MNEQTNIQSSATADDVLVRVENVSKKFCKSLKRSLWYGVKDVMTELNPFSRSAGGGELVSSSVGQFVGSEGDSDLRTNEQTNSRTHPRPALRRDEFWAVRDVSFELKRGECLGLIGRNGAGKSTLLKILNGIIKPDTGRVEMHGRVGALIELGAGFNPILTGRENIYNKGAVLGFTKKEMDGKFDAIVDFAEIEDFIDTPVQNYSSGMKVRLGFAVSAQMEPDVLIIDEVLAVGDVGFRAKCYNTIYEICKNACVIFVSHGMPQVDRLCSSAIMLKKGREELNTRQTGPVIDAYYRSFTSCQRSFAHREQGVEFRQLTLNGVSGRSWSLEHGVPLTVAFNLRVPSKYRSLEIKIGFHRPSFELLAYANSRVQGCRIANDGAWYRYSVVLDKLLLGTGKKLLSVSIVCAESNTILYWLQNAGDLQISSGFFISAPMLFPALFKQLPA